MNEFIDKVEYIQNEIKKKTINLLMFIFMFFEIFLNTTRRAFNEHSHLLYDEEKQLPRETRKKLN